MTITFGTQKEIDPSGDFVNSVGMTSTTAIAFYASAADGIQARHMTLAGGVISVGAELTIDGTISTNTLASTKLTDSTALVYYETATIAEARVITVTGTSLSIGAAPGLTDKNISFSSLATLSSTSVILVYSVDSSGDGVARILSISGTTVTENASFTFDATGADNTSVMALSSTKAIVCFNDTNNSNRPTGEVLDIAGTVITGNADVQLTTTAASTGLIHRLVAQPLSSTKGLLVYADPTVNLRGIAFTESGGSLTPGVDKLINSTGNLGVLVALVANSATKATSAIRTTTDIRVNELSVSGTTITIDDEDGAGFPVLPQSLSYAFLDETTSILAWDGTAEAISVGISAVSTLSLPAMTKPADVDASGTFIYLALMNNGTPILTKISTALDSDGSTVFDPGAGTDIGVECGRFDPATIWVGGNFDGSNVIEKSEDAGVTFDVKDPGSFGVIRTFVVGPDSDSRVLMFDINDAAIRETVNSGIDWININDATSFDKRDMARLAINVQETVVGNDGGASNSIQYSVNSADDLEDFQTGVYPNATATKVIVN